MSKSIEFNDGIYLDSSSVVHNKKKLSEILNTKDVYSNNEIKTNKIWIDGKPIYRKILNFTLGTQNQYERVEHGISNIYWIISQTVIYNYGGNIYYAPNGHITETNVNGTYFSYFNNNSYIVGSNAYAIIEYTKNN